MGILKRKNAAKELHFKNNNNNKEYDPVKGKQESSN